MTCSTLGTIFYLQKHLVHYEHYYVKYVFQGKNRVAHTLTHQNSTFQQAKKISFSSCHSMDSNISQKEKKFSWRSQLPGQLIN